MTSRLAPLNDLAATRLDDRMTAALPVFSSLRH
jgi:hypothetical protein